MRDRVELQHLPGEMNLTHLRSIRSDRLVKEKIQKCWAALEEVWSVMLDEGRRSMSKEEQIIVESSLRELRWVLEVPVFSDDKHSDSEHQ
jgi:hypothetical protein